MLSDVQEKILITTGIGSGVLYLFKHSNQTEVSKYRDPEDGKFIWWKFFFDFVIHIAMAVLGASLCYLLFSTPIMEDFREYQLISCVIAGLISRETLPILLDLAREEVEVMIESRRNNRNKG